MWLDPSNTKPKVGDLVWVMVKHHKTDNLLSCEIIGAEVCETTGGLLYAENMDYVGAGCLSYEFAVTKEDLSNVNKIVAWCHKNMISVPSWAPGMDAR